LPGEISLYFFSGKGRRRWTRWYRAKDLNNLKPLPGAKPVKRGWHRSEYTCPKANLQCRELSQKDAEKLVIKIQELSPTCCVAIQERFAHIIPENLRNEIALAPNGRFRCKEKDLIRDCKCFSTKEKTA
jgi:hypothetical protein